MAAIPIARDQTVSIIYGL